MEYILHVYPIFSYLLLNRYSFEMDSDYIDEHDISSLLSTNVTHLPLSANSSTPNDKEPWRKSKNTLTRFLTWTDWCASPNKESRKTILKANSEKAYQRSKNLNIKSSRSTSYNLKYRNIKINRTIERLVRTAQWTVWECC